jgi:hypothetical protein
MLKVVKKSLSYDAINRVIELYHSLPNLVKLEQNDTVVDRHTIGLVGKFMLSKFSQEEFDFVWQEVKEHIENELGPVELVYARVLKYNTTCMIQKHLDSANESTSSDISVIIQLSDPATYKGGEMIVSNRLIDLQMGDMVFYTYEHEHEVKLVKEGIRYVVNLRCKMVK